MAFVLLLLLLLLVLLLLLLLLLMMELYCLAIGGLLGPVCNIAGKSAQMSSPACLPLSQNLMLCAVALAVGVRSGCGHAV